MGVWKITEMKPIFWINQVHQYWSSWCCWHGFGFRCWYRQEDSIASDHLPMVFVECRCSSTVESLLAVEPALQRDKRITEVSWVLKWYELLASVTKGMSSNLILAHKLAGSSLTLWRRQQFSGFAKQDKWDKILFEPPQPRCRLVSVTKSNNLDLNLFWAESSKCDQLLVESEVKKMSRNLSTTKLFLSKKFVRAFMKIFQSASFSICPSS